MSSLLLLGRKWSRGISRASENLALVTRARNEVAKGFTLDDLACVPNHTFALPDLAAIQPEDFRAFVENDLIETATLVSLEQAGMFFLSWHMRSNHVCRNGWTDLHGKISQFEGVLLAITQTSVANEEPCRQGTSLSPTTKLFIIDRFIAN